MTLHGVDFSSVATVSRLSVMLRYRGRISWVTSKIITRIIIIFSFCSSEPHQQFSLRRTPLNLCQIGVQSLFSAENLQYL